MLTLLTIGAIVIWVAVAAAQEPGPRPAVFVTETRVLVSQRSPAAVTARLLSFDANADNRLSRDELPERMQELVARGDTNTDATLDLNEIRVLVTVPSSQRPTRMSVQSQTSEGLPGVIHDLKLAPAKHERALVIVGVQKPPRHANDRASSTLFAEMKALLDEEEYENFVAAATRLSRTDLGFRVGGVVGGVPQR